MLSGLDRIIGILKKIMDVVEKVVMVLTGIMLFIMMAVMCYQVTMRYVFSSANIWAEELTRYLFAWITLLASCVAIRRNAHLQVDFFINLLKPKVRYVVKMILSIGIIAFLIYLMPLAIDLCANTTTNLSSGLRIPMAVVYACIPTGTVFMILGMIEQLLKEMKAFMSEISKSPLDKGGEAL